MNLDPTPVSTLYQLWTYVISLKQILKGFGVIYYLLIKKLLLQKLIETSKSHRSPAPIPSEEFSVKRVLQSPETPHRGGSRKVYLIYIKLLICRVVQKLSSINTTNL